MRRSGFSVRGDEELCPIPDKSGNSDNISFRATGSRKEQQAVALNGAHYANAGIANFRGRPTG
jgi:hypothetical protein